MSRHQRWLLGAAGLAFGLLLARSMQRRVPLDGAVALVTGSSRGLGLQLARELADRGARVALTGRDHHHLERALDDLERRGAEVVAIPADLTVPEELRALVHKVRDVLGPIDLLVHNAGVLQVGPVDAMTHADHERALDVHYRALLRLVEEVLPDMRERGAGHIVTITSIGGRIAVPHMLPYTASKHAEVGLSRALRVELARDGIRVLTVFPWLMNTGSPRNAIFKGRHREEYTWFALAGRAPLLSLDARRAARRIVQAIESGRTELLLGSPARIAATIHDLFPRLSYAVIDRVSRAVLPGPSDDTRPSPGRENESETSRRLWRRRAARAERRFHQEVP